MSSSDLAVSVRGLGKSYTIAHQQGPAHNTLAEQMLDWVRHPLRRTTFENFWALQDVDFDVKAGDVVGVIGRNGAGKSTLLKLLSRITEPTTGYIELAGRVGSLLEVGTGFHPELTGRENIFLNGAILGMTKADIRKHFDEIVEFAGVEQFLDTPVKRYSSGMYVRLAFAVAAHLNSDILIIDEVLAVGDSTFQQKCLGKMRDVATSGRTVLFVSHNMNAVTSLCNVAIMLQKGRLLRMGPTQEIADLYSGSATAGVSSRSDLLSDEYRRTKGQPVLTFVELLDADGKPAVGFGPDELVTVDVGVRPVRPIHSPRLAIGLTTARGERVSAVASHLGPTELTSIDGETVIRGTFRVPPIMPGAYSMDIGLTDGPSDFIDAVYTAIVFEVHDTNYLSTTTPLFNEMGYIMTRSDWRVVAGGAYDRR